MCIVRPKERERERHREENNTKSKRSPENKRERQGGKRLQQNAIFLGGGSHLFYQRCPGSMLKNLLHSLSRLC